MILYLYFITIEKLQHTYRLGTVELEKRRRLWSILRGNWKHANQSGWTPY